MEYNSNWFKENLAKLFFDYKLEYRFFPEGDLGSLDEVVFENEKKGGSINYWGKGFLGIFLFDYEEEREIMNVLIDPNNILEKENAIKHLKSLIAFK